MSHSLRYALSRQLPYLNHLMWCLPLCLTLTTLQMLRDGQWHSYDTECQWMSFDALKVVHRVTPVLKGARYSITLYTPGKLDRLTAQDWDNLAKTGFPIHLYESLPAKMRRLTTHSHVMNITSEPEKTQDHGQSAGGQRAQVT